MGNEIAVDQQPVSERERSADGRISEKGIRPFVGQLIRCHKRGSKQPVVFKWQIKFREAGGIRYVKYSSSVPNRKGEQLSYDGFRSSSASFITGKPAVTIQPG